MFFVFFFFFFQAEDGIRDHCVTGVQTCALPILSGVGDEELAHGTGIGAVEVEGVAPLVGVARSEEHTSELQSHSDLVCRLLLEKKNSGSKRPSWRRGPKRCGRTTKRRATCASSC